ALPLRLAVLRAVRERLPVHAGGAAVVPATRQRVSEHVEAVHLVVQRIEAVRGCSLRFGLQRLLQLLNRLGGLGSSPILRLSAASDVDLELRSLPSTGITRFRRYYG